MCSLQPVVLGVKAVIAGAFPRAYSQRPSPAAGPIYHDLGRVLERLVSPGSGTPGLWSAGSQEPWLEGAPLHIITAPGRLTHTRRHIHAPTTHTHTPRYVHTHILNNPPTATPAHSHTTCHASASTHSQPPSDSHTHTLTHTTSYRHPHTHSTPYPHPHVHTTPSHVHIRVHIPLPSRHTPPHTGRLTCTHTQTAFTQADRHAHLSPPGRRSSLSLSHIGLYIYTQSHLESCF